MFTDERQLMMWAAAALAVTYLVLTFAAGAWVEPRPLAWKCALVSAGLGYLCTIAKAYEARCATHPRFGAARPLFWLSLVAGAVAGAALV